MICELFQRGDRPTTIDEYLATLPDDTRAVVEELREVIRTAASRAEEAFSYGLPAFRLDGRPLVWFAAWKRHCGLYPISVAVLHAHVAEVDGYETAKGTIRFPASRPLPYGLVKKFVEARVAELGESSEDAA